MEFSGMKIIVKKLYRTVFDRNNENGNITHWCIENADVLLLCSLAYRYHHNYNMKSLNEFNTK